MCYLVRNELNLYSLSHGYSYYSRYTGNGGAYIIQNQNMTVDYLRNSIDSNFPAILYANTGKLSYYSSSSTHYICVVGYDSITSNFIVRDCNYNTDYSGEFIVSDSDIHDAGAGYQENDYSYYYFICKTY